MPGLTVAGCSVLPWTASACSIAAHAAAHLVNVEPKVFRPAVLDEMLVLILVTPHVDGVPWV